MATSKTSSTSSTTSTSPASAATPRKPLQLPAHYASELARSSSTLFVGILVAIAFLLLGGLHQPPLWLLIFMYTALGATALASLLSLPINLLQGLVASAPAGDQSVRLGARLRILQIAQMIIFVIAIAAAVGFAIEMSTLFFPAASTTTPTTGQAG